MSYAILKLVPDSFQIEELLAHALQRSLKYERKLSSIGQRHHARRDKAQVRRKPPDGAPGSTQGESGGNASHIESLEQNLDDCSALLVELLQCCTKPVWITVWRLPTYQQMICAT